MLGKKWVQRRQDTSVYSSLVKELQIEDSQQYVTFLRMSGTEVETIIKFIGDNFSEKDTKMRQVIFSKVRVMITLRFLASGM